MRAFQRCLAGFGRSNPRTLSSYAKRIRGSTPTVGECVCCRAGTALRNCKDRVDALVDRVRRTAAEIFNIPLGPETEHEVFELGEDPYWVTDSTRVSLIPDPSGLIDHVLPAALRRPRIRARMVKLADELIVRNAENLRWAILRGLDETFRKATAQFEDRLDETIEATRGVIQGCARAEAGSILRRPAGARTAWCRGSFAGFASRRTSEPAMTMAGGPHARRPTLP